MKRTAGMVLVGICEILIGLVLLLIAAATVWMMGRSDLPPTPGLGSAKTLFGLLAGFYTVLGASAVATGIGVFMARNWARFVTLIAGGIFAVISAMAALMMALIPLPAPAGNVTPAQMQSMRFAMVGIWVVIGLIGVWWLILFTRPRIVELFKNADGGAPAERTRPLSVSVLGWYYFIFSIGYFFFVVFTHYPSMLFGRLIQGGPATVVNLTWAVVYGLLGVGLLRLDRRALWGTLAMMVFGIINMLFISILPGKNERIQEMMKASPGYDPQQAAMVSSVYSARFMLIIIIFSFGIPAYFLITRRAAFDRAPRVESTETLVV